MVMVKDNLATQLQQDSLASSLILEPEGVPEEVVLFRDLGQRLQRARPRLLRIARAFGVPDEAVEDCVQEALLRAWCSLARLRTPAGFDAWVDTICRNQCRMYLRARRALPQSSLPAAGLGAAESGAESDDVSLDDFADPRAADPLDALAQRDVALLLDRALGYLSPHARLALEWRYLRDVSSAEVATSLGISTPVLEARLHRARAQLRAALEGPLRAEAEELGLSGMHAPGWQATRIWCSRCGRHRLLGAFERAPSGRAELRLRCPDCSSRHGVDVFRSKGIAPLDGMRSFRAAMTRSIRALAQHTRQRLASGSDTCLHCGSPVRRRVATAHEFPADLPPSLPQHWVVAACHRRGCRGLGAWPAIEPAIWLHPLTQRFIAAHERWMTMPEETVEWAGHAAIRFHLVDRASAVDLTFFADRQTLDVLAAFG